MKIFKSIKWRLQIWYGLILVVVLAGFGFLAYQLESEQTFRQIDDELQRRIGMLANALHRPPPREPRLDDTGPPPDEFGGRNLPPMLQRERPLPIFHLRPEDARFFDARDPHNYFFKITRGDNEIASSTNQLPEPAVEVRISNHAVNRIDNIFPTPAALKNSPSPQKAVNYRNYREILQIMPSGEMVQVGCYIGLK